MMRPLLFVVAVLLVACSDPVTAPSAGEPGAQHDAGAAGDGGSTGDDGGASGGAAGEEAPGDDGRGGEQGDGSEPEAPQALPERDEELQPAICPDTVTDAVGATIGAQLDAFARGDYPAALAQASPGFQAGTDVNAFQRLIERDYPLLLDGARVEVEGCAQLRDDVSDVIAVIVTADGTRTRFLYRLRLAEDRWGIEAAARLDPPPATA
jgi:hypothetical protein